MCGLPFKGRPEFDHRKPIAFGGTNDLSNCVVACKPCHAEKTAKEDVPRIRLADRQKDADIGANPSKQPMAKKPKPAKTSFKQDQLRALGPTALMRQVGAK